MERLVGRNCEVVNPSLQRIIFRTRIYKHCYPYAITDINKKPVLGWNPPKANKKLKK